MRLSVILTFFCGQYTHKLTNKCIIYMYMYVSPWHLSAHRRPLVACGKCRWVIAKCARFSSFFWPPVGWNADGQTYSIALLPHAPTHNLFIHAYINLYLYPQTTINTYPFATICCDCSCLKVVVFVLLFWQFKIWLNWS